MENMQPQADELCAGRPTGYIFPSKRPVRCNICSKVQHTTNMKIVHLIPFTCTKMLVIPLILS